MKLNFNSDLNNDQKAFIDTAQQFAREQIQEHALDWDQKSFFPREVLKNSAELGFAAIYVDSDEGGSGLTRLDASLIFEELAYACPSTSAFLSIHNMATWMLSEFGNNDLKKSYLPSLTSMDKIASYCLTEPSSGSDASSLLTKAKPNKDNTSLTVNGSKAFISGAGESELYFVMMKIDSSKDDKISCLIMEKDYEGLSFGKNEKKMGWKNQPTRQVNFDNCKVPYHNLVGKEGEGFKIAMRGLDGGRINIASCSLGAARFCIDKSLEYIKERKQFGKYLSEFQSIEFKIADMITEYEAARLLVHKAANAIDNNDTKVNYKCAMAKKYATDVCFNICNEALQIHGGYGYLTEYGIEKMVRDTRVHQILEGTNEIMKVIISRSFL